jgi:hypothetical protein
MLKFFWRYREVFFTLAMWTVFMLPMVVSAAGGALPGGNPGVLPGNNPGKATLTNPLSGITSICKLVVALVQGATIIGIPIAVLFIVIAGFNFIIARGNPAKISAAQKNLYNVIIGIAIFVGASVIANLVVGTLKELGVRGINSC